MPFPTNTRKSYVQLDGQHKSGHSSQIDKDDTACVGEDSRLFNGICSVIDEKFHSPLCRRISVLFNDIRNHKKVFISVTYHLQKVNPNGNDSPNLLPLLCGLTLWYTDHKNRCFWRASELFMCSFLSTVFIKVYTYFIIALGHSRRSTVSGKKINLFITHRHSI